MGRPRIDIDLNTGTPNYPIAGCDHVTSCSWPYCPCEVIYDAYGGASVPRRARKVRRQVNWPLIHTIIVWAILIFFLIYMTGAPFPWQW